MKKDIRQQKILDYLSHFERISISEICEIFDIVPMTARRDLKELENDHKLIRTHDMEVQHFLLFRFTIPLFLFISV